MSKIEWTGKTWNPVHGCTPVSPGCRNCYAERMAKRLGIKGKGSNPEEWPEQIRVREWPRTAQNSMESK